MRNVQATRISMQTVPCEQRHATSSAFVVGSCLASVWFCTCPGISFLIKFGLDAPARDAVARDAASVNICETVRCGDERMQCHTWPKNSAFEEQLELKRSVSCTMP